MKFYLFILTMIVLAPFIFNSVAKTEECPDLTGSYQHIEDGIRIKITLKNKGCSSLLEMVSINHASNQAPNKHAFGKSVKDNVETEFQWTNTGYIETGIYLISNESGLKKVTNTISLSGKTLTQTLELNFENKPKQTHIQKYERI